MKRTSHPMFAGLVQAGGSAARLTAAVDRADEVMAALGRALEAIPLDTPHDWGGLVARVGGDDQLAPLLARLAAEVSTPEPRAIPDHPTGSFANGEGSTSSQRQALALSLPDPSHSRPQTTSTVPVRPKHPWPVDAVSSSPLPSAAIDDPTAPLERQAFMPKMGAILRHPSSPNAPDATSAPVSNWYPNAILQQAARRAVTPDSSQERRRAVAQILAGQAVTGPGALISLSAAPLSHSEVQIVGILAKFNAEVARHDAESAPQADRALVVQAAPPQPAPRNGLERLLAQAGKARVTIPNTRQGQQARLAANDVSPPDLAQSQRPPIEPASDPAPANPAAMAQALVMHLRREALAAGIDLNGGTG